MTPTERIAALQSLRRLVLDTDQIRNALIRRALAANIKRFE